MSKNRSPGDGGGSVARPRSASYGSPGSGSSSSYFNRRSRRPSSWIRACSRTRARAPSAVALELAAPSAAARSPSASSVATPRSDECPPLPRRDAGDEAEVVVRPPSARRTRPPSGRRRSARPAPDTCRRRERPAARLVGHRRQESVPRAAVVGHVVVDAQALDGSGAAAEGHVEPFRPDPLDPLELVDVRADLEDGAGLDVAGELRVGDLVVVRAPDRRPVGVVDAEQEVGVTAPRPIEERGLVDDVGAGRHGLDRSRPRPRGADRRDPRSSRPGSILTTVRPSASSSAR